MREELALRNLQPTVIAMQNQQENKLTPQKTLNSAGFLLLCCATTITPFTRKKFGVEALGFNGFGAFILLLVMAGADETGVALWYFLAWFIALIIRRLQSESAKGVRHSCYDGTPWLAMMFCKSEGTAKRVVEPLLCVGAGLGLAQVSPTVGALVMTGAFAIAMLQSTRSMIDRLRIQKMRDAELEMKHLRELYRNGGNY